MTLFALLRRQFRHSRWPSVLLASIVLVVSALLCAWPRAVDAMYTADLQQSVSNLAGSQQAIRAFGSASPPDADFNQPMEESENEGQTARALERIRTDLAQPLGSALGDGRWIAMGLGSPVISPLPDRIRELVLNYAVDLQVLEHIEVIEGTLPGPPPDEIGGDPIELLLSEDSAEAAKWTVGEEGSVRVRLSATIRERENIPSEQRVVLSGIYKAIDPGAEYWSLNNTLLSAAEEYDPDTGTAVNATAFISPRAFLITRLAAEQQQTSYWYPMATEALTARTAPQVEAQLREFLGTPQSVPAAFVPGPTVVFGSETPDAIAEATQRAASTNQILALLASGPLGVCLATAALAVRLLIERRRQALALVSARGASEWQVRGSLALDGLILAVPAAALGALAAILLVPVPFAVGHVGWAVAAAFVPAALMALQHRRGDDARDDLAPFTRNRWRLSAEGAVVVLAVVATTLLFQRGIAQGTLEYGEVDALLSATPLLIALAVCVLVLRLYPVPLAWFARARRRQPGLIGFLGATRAVRSPGAGLVPVLALIVGLAVVLFSGVLLSTFRAGVGDAAQADVGADLRIQGPPFTTQEVAAIGEVDGVTSVAPVTDLSRLRAEVRGETKDVNLLTTDPSAMRGVQEGLAGAFPPSLLAALEEPTSDGALPVVVSPVLELEPGTAVELRYRGTTIDLEVVGVGSENTVFTPAAEWMLVGQDAINSVEERTFQPSVILTDLGEDADPQAVMGAVEDITGPQILLQTPDQNVERTLGSASGFGLQLGLWAVIVSMVLLCSLTIVMTSVVNTPARNRLISLLRTLGFPPRRDGALMLWELGPIAAAAILAGTALGLVLPLIILDSIDLSAFTGGEDEPALAINPLLVLALVAGFMVVVLASLAAAVAAGRRQRLAAVLRMTDS
ncbi:putative ABC transport system permease protein [Arthrobacter pigmenti]|uniref:Putative ABC transport system permease protein n=1 Tax=Arthrobacter pigmenti TaxID=271432 RepID=A0A846RRP7_9MICC|nr:putative ABC transport system permease protein [Arthrobacter pigmenti]